MAEGRCGRWELMCGGDAAKLRRGGQSDILTQLLLVLVSSNSLSPFR